VLGRSIAVALAAVLAHAPGAWAGCGVALQAEAGLGGLCKAARWTPVRVEIDAQADVDGMVMVRWGDALVTQRVDMPAPSHRSLQLYIRTADARAAIEVRLQSGGRDVQTIALPVRLAGADEPIVVCAGRSAAGGECSTAIAAERLPDSWRGYDAATEVRVPGGTVLTAEQARAIDVWRQLRRLEESGMPAVGAVPTPERVPPRLRAALIAYVALMIVTATAWSGRG